MSSYRITMSFDLSIDDDDVLTRIAAAQVALIEQDAKAVNKGRPFASLARRVTRRAMSPDIRTTFNLAAVAMLSEGAAKVPGLSIDELTVRCEAVN
jgi:hypothetical protein